MKKWLVILMTAVLLTGCGSRETLETIADELVIPVMAQPKQTRVKLPGEAALPTLESDNGRLYLCSNYEISLQTLAGGDLDATLQAVTGYGREKLTVLESLRSDLPCYEFSWSCAGESGDRVGQGIILDDGTYHYCLTALWDADKTEDLQIVWSEIFSSFDLV
ncbi:MAG: hypothetical protein IJA75_06625 [Oscillospiraceae bacterium]|nr:hypothetical protein [Oscillospiraceae bacterium]